jgi:Sjogren's syndrome/scleroderma autoantigen 1 (Autoantigen p27)
MLPVDSSQVAKEQQDMSILEEDEEKQLQEALEECEKRTFMLLDQEDERVPARSAASKASDVASKRIGQKLLAGWTLLGQECGKCHNVICKINRLLVSYLHSARCHW